MRTFNYYENHYETMIALKSKDARGHGFLKPCLFHSYVDTPWLGTSLKVDVHEESMYLKIVF